MYIMINYQILMVCQNVTAIPLIHLIKDHERKRGSSSLQLNFPLNHPTAQMAAQNVRCSTCDVQYMYVYSCEACLFRIFSLLWAEH